MGKDIYCYVEKLVGAHWYACLHDGSIYDAFLGENKVDLVDGGDSDALLKDAKKDYHPEIEGLKDLLINSGMGDIYDSVVI